MDEEQAVRLFCKALGTPYEVNGAAYQNGIAMLRVEGLEAQVAYRISSLQALFPKLAMSILEGAVHDDLWTGLRDLHIFSGSDDAVWKLSVKPTDASAIVSHLKRKLAARAVLDQGGGTIWVAVPSDAPGQGETIRSALKSLGGRATLVRGSEELRHSMPVFQPQANRSDSYFQSATTAIRPVGNSQPRLDGSVVPRRVKCRRHSHPSN